MSYLDFDPPGPPDTSWTQAQAIELCRAVEAICPAYGCHIALTGGSLYKPGQRKDCDLLFYRIRQVEKINCEGLFLELHRVLGFTMPTGGGWVYKTTYLGKSIDCFFPEEDKRPRPPSARHHPTKHY